MDTIINVLSMFRDAQNQGSWGKGNGKGKGKGKGKFKDPKAQTMAQINAVKPELKVWVSGLPDKVTWKELQEHFELKDAKPRLAEVLAKGTGVCAFKDAEEATAAIAAVNDSIFKDVTIKVDVWTEKNDQNKHQVVPGGPEKRALEQRIKQLQRTDPEAKATWMAFTAEHHGGVNDPTRHPQEVLEEFLSAFA